MCDRNLEILEPNDISCWENRGCTGDEKQFLEYLKNINLNDKKILHMGIGNGEFANTLNSRGCIIDGFTISYIEKIECINKYDTNVYQNIYIGNKYNNNNLNKISDKYDIISDQGIKQYSCCLTHFNMLLDFYMSRLNLEGFLMVSMRGAKWGGYDIDTAMKCEGSKNTGIYDTKYKRIGLQGGNSMNILTYKDLDKYKISNIPNSDIVIIKNK